MNTSDKCGGSFVAGFCPGDSTIQVITTTPSSTPDLNSILVLHDKHSAVPRLPLLPPPAVQVLRLLLQQLLKKASPTSGVVAGVTGPPMAVSTAPA